MKCRTRIEKMRDNPTYGRIGTHGMFQVFIECADDNDLDWRYLETVAENVTYEEGLQIELTNREALAAKVRALSGEG